MNVRVLNDQAHALVSTSVQDLQSGLSIYRTEEGLAILRIAYIIARRRRDDTKCKLLASKIRRLDAALHSPSGSLPKAKIKQPYIVIRCAMCRDYVGKGKGKAAAIVDAKSHGAHIVPVLVKGQKKKTIICGSCFDLHPSVRIDGIVQ